MSSYYIVNFTDPLTPPVNISPMQLDGPGSLQSASTTLRLHGAGYLGWGEAVNENFVRMLENFMGSSAPIDPVAGQLWVNVQLYHLNTLTGTFYRFDITPSSGNYKTWVAMSVVSQATAPTSVVGTYWFNTTDNTLNLFTSAYDRTPAAWMNRTYSSGAGVPTHTPAQFVKVFDANLGPTGTWKDVGGVSAFVSSSTAAPTGNETGTLRYDPTTSMFYIWTGAAWESLTTGWGVGANVTDSTAPPPGNVVGSVRYAPSTQMFYVWTGSTWESISSGWGVGAVVSDSSAAPVGDVVGSLRYAPAVDMFYIWTGSEWESLTSGWGVGAVVTDNTAAPVGDIVGSLRYAPATNMFYVWTGSAWESLTSGWGTGAFVSNSSAAPVGDVIGSLRWAPAVSMFYIWTGDAWESLTTGWGVGALVTDSANAPVADVVGSLRFAPTDGAFYLWNGGAWVPVDTAGTGGVAGALYNMQSGTAWIQPLSDVGINIVQWNTPIGALPTNIVNSATDISANAARREHPLYTSSSSGWYSAYHYATSVAPRLMYEFTAPAPSRVLWEIDATAVYSTSALHLGGLFIQTQKFVGGVWVPLNNATNGAWHAVTTGGGVYRGDLAVAAAGPGTPSSQTFKWSFDIIFPSEATDNAYHLNMTPYPEFTRDEMPPFEANIPHRVIWEFYGLTATTSQLQNLSLRAKCTLIGA